MKKFQIAFSLIFTIYWSYCTYNNYCDGQTERMIITGILSILFLAALICYLLAAFFKKKHY